MLYIVLSRPFFFFFFFNDTATTEIYTLSLHDALPISPAPRSPVGRPAMRGAKLRSVPLHDALDIGQSRKAGGLAARVLQMLVPHVQPGVSTEHLDKLCHDFIVDELRCVPTDRKSVV